MVCQFGGIRGITNSDSLGSAKDGFGSVKILRNLRYVKYAGLTAWLLALIFIILINIGRSYASNQSDQAGAEAGLSTLATTVTGPAEVGMSDPGDVSLSAIAEGGIVTGGHNLTVSSTSVAGYKVAMESDGALKDDSFAGSESTNNTLIMPTTGGTLTAPAPLTNNSWGVAIVGNSGFDDVVVYQSTDQSVLSNAKFAPIPGRSGDNPDGQVIFSGNAATTGDTRTIYYGVKTDPYFRAGNYSTTVVYTITAELPDTPTITSVTPDSYQLESGASGQITIEGTNLSSAYSVYLTNASGDTVGDCTNLSVASDGISVTCTIPTTGISAGDYTIHVVTQGGGASVEFAYVNAPKPSLCRSGDVDNTCQVDLDANMIPIKYTGSTSNARWTSIANEENANNVGEWYDYDKKQWANAVTVKPSALSKYKDKSVVIDNNDVLGYWVYIPRYAYEVMRPNAIDRVVAQQDFNIHFEKATDSKKIPAPTCNILNPTAAQMWANGEPTKDAYADNANILAKDYRTQCGIPRQYGASEGTTWATHPVFSWGSKETGYTELNGIWFGKFMTTGTITNPTIKPNQHSNISETIGTFYTMGRIMGSGTYDPAENGGSAITNAVQNSHNLALAETHHAKNSEWAAVIYLATSQYGAGMSNIKPNTSYVNWGGQYQDADGDTAWYGVTGCGPSSASSNEQYTDGTPLTKSTIESPTACSSNKQRAYNGSIGQLASTTNNVYGVYDMNGEMEQSVAGNMTSNGTETETISGRMTYEAKEPYVDLWSETDGFLPNASPTSTPDWSYESDPNNVNGDICTWNTCGGDGLHEIMKQQSVNGVGMGTWSDTWGDASALFWYSSRGNRWMRRGGGAGDVGGIYFFAAGVGASNVYLASRAAMIIIPV